MPCQAEPDGFEERTLELPGRVIRIRAPAGWTDARLEAWLDWAGGADDLTAAVAEFVETLARRAQAKGLIKDGTARTVFREGLNSLLLSGAAAVGAAPQARAPAVIDADRDGAAEALQDFVAAWRGEQAAAAAATELALRLQLVMDAVLRCEGDPAACADPQANPGLGRAAQAARQAGASAALILDAIALAQAGEHAWRATAPAHAAGALRLVVAATPETLADETARALALAVHATGAVATAPSRAAADQLAEAARAVRGGIDLMAFWTEGRFDVERFEAAVGLLAQALAAASGGPALLGLAGLGDWLAAHGLDYDSEAGRETARELYLAAAAAAAR
jgi:ribonucleoside-diphosphate reductase alpha chain